MEKESSNQRQLPSFGMSLIVFVIVAFIISYGTIAVEAEVHMPIVTAAVFVALVARFVLRHRWEDLEESAIQSIMAAMQAFKNDRSQNITVVLFLQGMNQLYSLHYVQYLNKLY